MRLVAYQTDIPQNLGALMRVAACFDAPLDVIGPCGFPFSDRDVKRVAMDYADLVNVTVHISWPAFLKSEERKAGRLVLLTTKAASPLPDFDWRGTDLIMVGRESAGVPDHVHEEADARLRIPMADGARSLNVAVSAGIALASGFHAA